MITVKKLPRSYVRGHSDDAGDINLVNGCFIEFYENTRSREITEETNAPVLSHFYSAPSRGVPCALKPKIILYMKRHTCNEIIMLLCVVLDRQSAHGTR
jgi:hypothetical protein